MIGLKMAAAAPDLRQSLRPVFITLGHYPRSGEVTRGWTSAGFFERRSKLLNEPKKENRTVGIVLHGLGRCALKAGAETRSVRRRPAQDLQTPQHSVTATRLFGKIAGTRPAEANTIAAT